jgi:uncharacterized protein YbaR (Trm112 family)
VGTAQSHPLFQTWFARVALKVGAGRFVHPLRRLWVPVPREALVLEVGSGNNPYPRSNVLVDFSLDDYERSGPLHVDRPLVLALGEHLSFRDKVFEYVIASHVLEHTTQPRLLLNELQRVGRAGYIETPEALLERLNPWSFHRSEVTVGDGQLVIYEKPTWKPDPQLTEMFLRTWYSQPEYHAWIRSHPWQCVVHYSWQGKMDYRIVNEGQAAQWTPPVNPAKKEQRVSQFNLRTVVRSLARRMLSPKTTIDLLPLLRCVDCKCETLEKRSGQIHCPRCGRLFESVDGVPKMFPPYHDAHY